MKKWRSHLFSAKQDKKNQQIQADSKNRIAIIGRNMSQGAANIFKSLSVHKGIGLLRGHGVNYKGNSKFWERTPSKKFGK